MRKIRRIKVLCLVMTVCMLAGVFTGFIGTTGVKAATNYVDTSDYEALYEAYSDYFKVGVAIPNWNYYSGADLKARQDCVLNIFNSVTCENEMKPDALFSPNEEGLFKIGQGAEAMLVWAKANGMKLRGHTLVWHSQVNPAIFAKDFKPTSNGKVTKDASATLDEDCLVDADTLRERMKTYIYSVMKYVYENGYGDVIYAWDVVNEAVDEGKDDGLRRSTWYRILGPDFLYYAFLYAREASVKYSTEYASLYGLDPAKDDLSVIRPLLLYNDYNEWFQARVNVVKLYATEYKFNENQSLVKSDVIKKDGDGTMLGDGLIDGVGMQCHLSDNQDINTYMRALRQYSEAVGLVQITEMDVGCTTFGENQWFKQAKFYYDFFSALIEEIKAGANVHSVTLWGLTDQSSWRSSDYPLVLNADFSIKPAYNAMLMAAKGEEFNIALAATITDLKDVLIDFEPYKDANSTVTVDLNTEGILPRGSGHRPLLALRMRVNHTPDVALGFGLVCERKEVDANLKIDVSKFCGRNITVTMYGMTNDSFLRVGLDGDEPVLLRQKAAIKDEWVKLCFNTDIPEGDSAFLYVETDGIADICIDDISIVYTHEDEQPPVITDTDDTEAVQGSLYMPKTEEKTDSEPDAQTQEKDSADNAETAVNNTGSDRNTADSDSASETEKQDSPISLPVVVILIGGILACSIAAYRKKNLK